MTTKAHRLSSSLLLFVVATSPAFSSGILDYQQLPGHLGGFVSDGAVWTVADEFRFGQDTPVGGINWWGGRYLNPPPGPDNFTIRFYLDSGGQPGSLLEQHTIGAANKIATEQWVGSGQYREFKYSVNLATPFQAEGGVKYWVSIVNPTADFWQDFWLWEASGSTQNPGVQRSFSGGPWQPYSDNTAFEIIVIPEPTSTMFLVAGLAAAILFPRRWRET